MRIVCSLVIAGLILIAASCSSGPPPPRPGTPAFLWSAAKTTYAAGDFLKANDNLLQLTKPDNEFAARSQPWAIVISAGIARAYSGLADSFEAGARQNRANPAPFRRQETLFRAQAATFAMECAETVHGFVAGNKQDPILLELPYPAGDAAEPVQLQRVAKGILFPDAEIGSLAKAMVQRGVLLSVSQAVGAGDDAAKALAIFKAGEVKVPRAVFLVAVARATHEQGGLFAPEKLDQPDRAAIFYNEAEEALKAVPVSKETKDLETKIAKSRKALKKI